MNKQKTSKARRWKVATFLPLLALLLMAFSERSELPIEKNTLNEKVSVHEPRLKNDVKPSISEIIPISFEKNSVPNNKKKQPGNATLKKEQTIQVTEKTVKGKVVDSNEKPLEWASVIVSGKTIGTITNNEGIFSLNLTDTCSIVVSYVGFKSIKLAPDFEKLMMIKLEPENIGIDKVVVVAYAAQKKQELTIKGSINSKNDNPPSNNNEIFTIVEQMPEFPGGSLALRKYISQQIKYPVSAQKAGIQGKVFVSFVINSDGMASNVKIARSVDPALDNEAIRVVYTMPKWKQGFQHGKAVDVAFTIPIDFIIQ